MRTWKISSQTPQADFNTQSVGIIYVDETDKIMEDGNVSITRCFLRRQCPSSRYRGNCASTPRDFTSNKRDDSSDTKTSSSSGGAFEVSKNVKQRLRKKSHRIGQNNKAIDETALSMQEIIAKIFKIALS